MYLVDLEIQILVLPDVVALPVLHHYNPEYDNQPNKIDIMKKFFIVLSLLMVGVISGFAQTLTAKAYMTMDGQQLKLRERADYVVADPQATASDYNNVGVAAYYAGVRYVQFGTDDLEGLPLSVIVPMETNSINIVFNVAEGTQLYLVDASDGSRTPINAGENKVYAVNYESAAYAVNDRFSISKLQNPPAPPADILELNGTLGTIVSDREIASVPDGVVLYEILETDYANHITFQEVALPLAAGTPVLFQRTGDAAYVTLGTDYTTGEYVYANGFVGLLPGKDSRTVNVNSHVLVLVTADCKLKFATTSLTLTAGHAYIDMNAIIPANPAPGRRRLMIGRSGIVTDVENVAAEVKGARKSIENGKIVILKNGMKYNVAGQMMK